MTGRGIASIASMTVGMVLALGIASPAAAAVDPELQLSRDGTTFSDTLAGGLFDGLGLLVPGESVSASFWVRNPTEATAALRISIRELALPSTAYAEGVSMTLWSSATGSTGASMLAGVDQCDVLMSSDGIEPGSAEKITVTFAMGSLQGSTGQHEVARMSVAVSMRDAIAGGFPPSACDDDGVVLSSDGTSAPSVTGGTTGRLARTGQDRSSALVLGAALLSGVGLFLLRAARLRRHDAADPSGDVPG